MLSNQDPNVQSEPYALLQVPEPDPDDPVEPEEYPEDVEEALELELEVFAVALAAAWKTVKSYGSTAFTLKTIPIAQWSA